MYSLDGRFQDQVFFYFIAFLLTFRFYYKYMRPTLGAQLRKILSQETYYKFHIDPLQGSPEDCFLILLTVLSSRITSFLAHEITSQFPWDL